MSANVIRFRPTVDDDSKLWAAIADGLNVAQSQIDSIMNVLRQPIPQPQVIQITDPSGVLVAQIGNMTGSDNVAYPGIWAKDLYVGGNGPDTAVIVANDGGVVINGATIVLNKDGVLTTINNSTGPDGLTDSLTSQDISGGPTHGQLTAVGPFSFVCWYWNTISLQYEPVANLRATGSGAGRILLSRVNSGNAILLATDGTGAPIVNVSNGAAVTSVRATGLQTTGNVDAVTFSVSGVPGINAADTFMTSPGTGAFVTSISVSTSTISYNPGLSTATFVTGVGTSSGVAVNSFSSTNALYSRGLRTS